jgi:hypothetical protein
MRSTLGALLVAAAFLGCENVTPPTPSDATPLEPATQHSALSTQHSGSTQRSGSLTGRVTWHGPVPNLPPVRVARPQEDGTFGVVARPAPNPPAVDPATGGVAGAVVFLRAIDPAAGRPWDHPPVTVELHDERPMVRQGDGPPGAVGFVRRGDGITIVSRQPAFHALRARGAAFWTLTLPDPDRPRTRRLDQAGLVELSSAANNFWMHGYLWVSDHPYFARTDAAGRWALEQVPAGEYELVVWLPSWRVARQERDPEWTAVARYVMGRPLEQVRRVVVRGGEAVDVEDVSLGQEP